MTQNQTEILLETRVGEVVLTLRAVRGAAVGRYQAAARYPDGSELVIASDWKAEAESMFETLVSLEQLGIFDN